MACIRFERDGLQPIRNRQQNKTRLQPPRECWGRNPSRVPLFPRHYTSAPTLASTQVAADFPARVLTVIDYRIVRPKIEIWDLTNDKTGGYFSRRKDTPGLVPRSQDLPRFVFSGLFLAFAP